jgi:hypothetical protein
VAEREGFEPSVPFEYTRFPSVRLKPLGHLSGSPDLRIISVARRGGSAASGAPSESNWRRERDSNPRYGFKPYAGLANLCLQPLGHLSCTGGQHTEIFQRRGGRRDRRPSLRGINTPSAVPGAQGWRRGRDSNPRGTCIPGGFQDRCLQPLGHLSRAISLAANWESGPRVGDPGCRAASRRRSSEWQRVQMVGGSSMLKRF